MIAGGTKNGTVEVWDAETGAILQVVRSDQGHVSALAFSPDGNWIVTGSDEGTVQLWFIGRDAAELVEHACMGLPRDLSSDDIERFNLDPHTPWPCADHANTLWPHTMAGGMLVTTRPE